MNQHYKFSLNSKSLFMKKKSYSSAIIIFISILFYAGCSNSPEELLLKDAEKAMKKAADFFRTEVATHGGYLFQYSSDFTMRQGEISATATQIWAQPSGTPAVGMTFLKAYEATGDTFYLNGAINAARALTWGQLASGGWHYRIDFDPVESKKWHYRRDVEIGDTITGTRDNRSSLDDENTQSPLQLIMRVDKILDFKDEEIHNSAMYCLNALMEVQYPNGAWPQGFTGPPDPELFPVKKAHYPETWSREFPGEDYDSYYTFNDNAMGDVVTTMIEAYKIYGDERYLNSAKKCGDFIILAQMPEPQPAWAQQYNSDMVPAWARKFEPPAITGFESFSALRSLLELYINTGEERFLEPVPIALNYFKNSLLPDGRLARFYELQTNRPLYFNADVRSTDTSAQTTPPLKPYTLNYEDKNLPSHYSFKVSADPMKKVDSLYNKILEKGREAVLEEKEPLQQVNPEQIRSIIDNLDEKGRWLDTGRMRSNDPTKRNVETQIIACRTFNRNMSLLANYIIAVNKEIK